MGKAVPIKDMLIVHVFSSLNMVMYLFYNFYNRNFLSKEVVSVPLEEEVMGLLIGGASFVIGMAFLVNILLFVKNKNHRLAYMWVIVHLILLSIAIYFGMQSIRVDHHHPMASEEISLLLGQAGILWAESILCLIVGLIQFSKVKSP
jgi:hypothetical protein